MINTTTVYSIQNGFIRFRNTNKYMDNISLLLCVYDYADDVAVLAHGKTKDVNQIAKDFTNKLADQFIEAIKKKFDFPIRPYVIQPIDDLNVFKEYGLVQIDLTQFDMPEQVAIANELIQNVHNINSYQLVNQLIESVGTKKFTALEKLRNIKILVK